ncbi:MAG TPA: hypothetical protein VMC83_30320 [Streptosporangiaceae bacterium]|nr:hypothetical protein [Streptosporangiaceae bacterium]
MSDAYSPASEPDGSAATMNTGSPSWPVTRVSVVAGAGNFSRASGYRIRQHRDHRAMACVIVPRDQGRAAFGGAGRGPPAGRDPAPPAAAPDPTATP